MVTGTDFEVSMAGTVTKPHNHVPPVEQVGKMKARFQAEITSCARQLPLKNQAETAYH